MDGIKLATICLVILGIVAMGRWVLSSKMEAAAFNAVTGKSVTTWQAMWIELRVQEPGK